jgi:hypothetical protein
MGVRLGGRAPGTPNKATSEARQAIASFVDGNAHRLTEWLEKVAEGVKGVELDKEGNEVEVYVVPPNPAKAFDMFQSVVEYHVPKLARHEHTGDPEAPVVVTAHLGLFEELKKAAKLKKQMENNG